MNWRSHYGKNTFDVAQQNITGDIWRQVRGRFDENVGYVYVVGILRRHGNDCGENVKINVVWNSNCGVAHCSFPNNTWRGIIVERSYTESFIRYRCPECFWKVVHEKSDDNNCRGLGMGFRFVQTGLSRNGYENIVYKKFDEDICRGVPGCILVAR